MNVLSVPCLHATSGARPPSAAALRLLQHTGSTPLARHKRSMLCSYTASVHVQPKWLLRLRLACSSRPEDAARAEPAPECRGLCCALCAGPPRRRPRRRSGPAAASCTRCRSTIPTSRPRSATGRSRWSTSMPQCAAGAAAGRRARLAAAPRRPRASSRARAGQHTAWSCATSGWRAAAVRRPRRVSLGLTALWLTGRAPVPAPAHPGRRPQPGTVGCAVGGRGGAKPLRAWGACRVHVMALRMLSRAQCSQSRGAPERALDAPSFPADPCAKRPSVPPPAPRRASQPRP